MAEVTWQARRSADSVLVDVTADVDGMAESAPTPNAIETGGAVEQTVYSLTTALTNDQIKALPTTPVELVPAPGAGKTIMMLSAIVRVNTSSNGYTNVASLAELMITFAEEGIAVAQGVYANFGVGDTYLSDFLSAFTNLSVLLAPYTFSGVNTTAGLLIPVTSDILDIENKALQISIDNKGSGALTAGHANNNGSVTAVYTVIDL